MNQKQSNLNRVSVDSFKWRLPIELVSIINQDLLSAVIRQTVNKNTGEVISEEEIQNNSLKSIKEHYHIHFAVTNTFNKTEVVILINSKLLECHYLDGITIKNIETVYNRIIDCGIIKLTFEEFLCGNCTDIDFKKDISVESKEEFDSFTLDLERKSIAKKGIGFGCKRLSTSINKGIQWNRRESATPTNPFIKIYHKEIESINGKNNAFFNCFVDPNKLKNRIRIESTIKNKKHSERLKIKSLKLIDILSLSQDQMNYIFEDSIKQNLEPRIRKHKPKRLNQLSPQDKMNFSALTFIIEQGNSVESAIDHLLSCFTNEQKDRNAKTRNKKRLVSLYEEQIKGELYEQKSRKESAFFNEIRWF